MIVFIPLRKLSQRTVHQLNLPFFNKRMERVTATRLYLCCPAFTITGPRPAAAVRSPQVGSRPDAPRQNNREKLILTQNQFALNSRVCAACREGFRGGNHAECRRHMGADEGRCKAGAQAAELPRGRPRKAVAKVGDGDIFDEQSGGDGRAQGDSAERQQHPW
jgi:hypothetical protein